MGVFRAPKPDCNTYEGFWLRDPVSNMYVFRENRKPDMVENLIRLQ